jgi:predicted small secreted protein
MKLLLLLALVTTSFSQNIKEIKTPSEKLIRKEKALVNLAGKTRARFRLNEATSGNSAKERALSFLNKNATAKTRQRAKASQVSDGLRHIKTQRMPNSTHVRFQQTLNGIDIYGADIVVSMNKTNFVQMAMDNRQEFSKAKTAIPSISELAAVNAAFARLNSRDGLIGTPKTKLMYFKQKKEARLVYKVSIVLLNKEIQGDFEFLIDAENAEILRFENIIKTYHSKKDKTKKKKKAQGQGYVFNPDPLSLARKNYGDTGFSDANDSDTNGADSLNAYRELVTLNDLTLEAGLYHLKNDYVEILDIEAPNETYPALADPNAFLFTRSQQGFEAVNVFYHIDKSARYLESLGFLDIKPDAYSGGIKSDPHGESGADNSHFSPSGDFLVWGEGGVDDAEDADVIIHEYGHAVQDFIVAGFAGNDGLGEGFSDYWAQSYSRETTNWLPSDPQYHYMFSWDGHNEYWDGRTTDFVGHYPESKNGGIHHDGQLWSTPLMQLFDRVGKEVCDKIVIQSHYYLSTNANQVANAEALLQADEDLFAGANKNDILDVFRAYGQLAHYTETPPVENILITANNNRVDLYWESPSDSVLSYSLNRSTTRTESYTTLLGSFQNNFFTDSTALNEQDYYYFIIAHYTGKAVFSDTLYTRPSANLFNRHYAVVQLGTGETASLSAERLQSSLRANGGDAPLIDFFPSQAQLANIDALFISLGSYSTNYLLSENDWQNHLKPYLDAGGNIYLEGADTWAYDPSNGGTAGHLSYFGISGLDDGDQVAPSSLTAVAFSFAEGLTFNFSSDEEYVDEIAATGSGLALFTSDGGANVRIVSNNTPAYKTIGAAPSFGGFADGAGANKRDSLMLKYMHFFDSNAPQITVNTDSIIAESFVSDSSFTVNLTIENSGSDLALIYTISAEVNETISENLFLNLPISDTVANNNQSIETLIVNPAIPEGIYTGRLKITSNADNTPVLYKGFRLFPHGTLEITERVALQDIVYNEGESEVIRFRLDTIFNYNSFEKLSYNSSQSNSTIGVIEQNDSLFQFFPSGKIGETTVSIRAFKDSLELIQEFKFKKQDTKVPELEATPSFSADPNLVSFNFTFSEVLAEPAYIEINGDSVLLTQLGQSLNYQAVYQNSEATQFQIKTSVSDSSGNSLDSVFTYTFASYNTLQNQLQISEGLSLKASIPLNQAILIRHDSLNRANFSPNFYPLSSQMTVQLAVQTANAVSFSFSAAAFNEQVAMYRLNESTWELYSYENNIEIESNGTFALFYNEALVYLPSKTELFQNYPNPFNPSTTIKVYLKTTSQVRISIYNSLGQRVRELVNGQLPAARHLFTWDGRNSNGEKVSSGIYFYQLSTNSFTKVKKMILIK